MGVCEHGISSASFNCNAFVVNKSDHLSPSHLYSLHNSDLMSFTGKVYFKEHFSQQANSLMFSKSVQVCLPLDILDCCSIFYICRAHCILIHKPNA